MNRLIQKRIIARIYRSLHKVFSRNRPARSVILMYHSIGDSVDSVPTEQFTAQMLWLANHAKVISFEKMLTARYDAAFPLRCAISFDDGYENFYHNAFPVLEQLNFPSVAYIPAGVIGESNQYPSSEQKGLNTHESMLSWSQVRELSRRGVLIGSHSFDHLDFARLDERTAVSQLDRSKLLITERIGKTCSHFAYPWGRFNADTLQALDKLDYASAVTVLHKGITLEQNRYLLPRVNVWGNYTLEDFQSAVIGEFDFISKYQLIRDFLIDLRM